MQILALIFPNTYLRIYLKCSLSLSLCIFCLIFDSQVEPINLHRLNDYIECVPIYILYSPEFNAE